ncbi:hypothetical protein FACS1894109_01450 [Spirochaetia bacterium]|nr:hypothetical protein FACS1894109_01450 [Spirochaetia bacterium]
MKRVGMFLFVLVSITAISFAQTATEPAPRPAPVRPGQAAAPAAPAAQTSSAAALPAALPAKKTNLDIEMSLGVPVHFTNNIDGPAENTVNVATGIGLTYNILSWLGISFDADFAFAQNTSSVSLASKASNFYSIFSTNVLLGPIFYLYADDHFRIPLAVDVHFGFNKADYSEIGDPNGKVVSQSISLLGPALQIGLQFHFSKDFYIMSRIAVTCDIVSFGTNKTGGVESDRETPEMSATWGIKPVLGVGLRL